MQNKMLRLFEQKVLNGLLHIGWARSLHRHDSFTARASEKSKMGERVNAAREPKYREERLFMQASINALL